MNFTKKLISVLLVCLMVFPFSLLPAFAAETDTETTLKTVYLSDSGADTNDGLSSSAPVKTITKAYKLLGTGGGTITIVGAFTLTGNFSAPAHTGTVTIKGDSTSAKLIMAVNCRFYLGGATVFDGFTLDATKGTFFLICLFNQFTATDSYSTIGSKDVLISVATPSGGTDFGSARDVEITLNGGRWTEVIGGMRGGLAVSGGTKTPEHFKDYHLTFNIGGSVTVNKLFALNRSVSSSFIAPNSSCEINLNGGVVTHFICQNDAKTVNAGYENGITVKIADTFDLSQSFDGVSGIDPDTRLASNLYYGISGSYAWSDATYTASSTIECNTLVVADDIYDATIANNKVRLAQFAEVVKESEAAEPVDVYLSDTGVDTNDGLSAATPVKTLTRAYKLLGKAGGTLTIVGAFTQTATFSAPAHTGTVTIKGDSTSAKLIMGANCRFYLGGDTVFDGFTLDTTKGTFYLICLFNQFTATDSYNTTGTNQVFVSVASPTGGSDFGSARDVEITLNGGRWTEVIGGMKGGLAVSGGTKTTEHFKDYHLTFNIGGSVTVSKLFAFHRTISTTDFIAPNSSCTVNLDGGVVTHFVCQNDQKSRVQGYENGLTVKIGKNFDLAGSFDAVDVDADTRLDSNKLFYGISAASAFDASVTTGTMISCNTLYIADEVYDEYKVNNKIRIDDFSVVKMRGELPSSDKVVYVSSSGDNNNDGLTADTPVKTITTAYHKLGTDGGTIIIVGTFTHTAHYSAPAHTGKVVIKGADENAKYVMGGGYRYFLGGPTVFTDITLDVTSYSMFFICLYHDFIATDTFKVVGAKDVLIGAGGQHGGNDFGSARDVSITLNGGRFSEVFGCMRSGLTAGGVAKTAADFKDHEVTFNIGGNVTVGKLFAFNRSVAGNIIAPNSSCTINLNGGVVTNFICQNDQKAYTQGYENGITINVGKLFDITKSFEGGSNVDPVTRLDSNNLFNGISPKFAFAPSVTTATGAMSPVAVLVVADEIYDSFIADPKVRLDDFSIVKKMSGAIDYTVVYVSDNGSETNDGLTADTPIKSLDAAYELLGNNGGTIIIVGTYTQSAHFFEPEHSGKIIIKGADENAVYNITKNTRYTLDGETEFTNLHIKASGSATWYIICNFNNCKISDTVTVTRTGTFIITLGAQSGTTANDRDYTIKNATLTIEGGDWSEVIGYARNGFASTQGTRKESDYAGISLVINVDKNASVDKIFGFGRTISNGSAFVPDADLRVNLYGGQINNFIGQTDNRTYAHGVANGMVIYIGKDFDISKCFLNGTQTEDHLFNDGSGRYVFYGISGESSYAPAYVTSTQIRKSGLIIAAELYDSIKDNSRILASTFGYIIKEGDPVPAYGGLVRPATNVVYISTSGHDLNNGKASNNAVKSLSVALEILGENGGNIYVENTLTVNTAITGTKHTVNIPEGKTLKLNADVNSFAAYRGKGTIVVGDALIETVTVDDFNGFEGAIVDKDGNNVFSDDVMYLRGTTGECEFEYNWITGVLTINGNGAPGKLVRARFATHVIFGEGVTSIPESFCYNNKNLKSVTLSSTITSIDRYAFQSTDNLTTFTVPENSMLATIGFKAFLFSGVTSLDFNDNLKVVEGYAFRDCHKLVSVDLGNGLESLGEYAFARTFKLQTVTFDGSFTALADCVFLQSSAITEIAIPDSVTAIGTKAFMNASALLAVDFSDGLLMIGDDAFKDTGLSGNVVLPSTVTTIGMRAFYRCTKLTGLTLPAGLSTIGDYCFGLSAITSLDIPSSVTAISTKAFYGCPALNTVTINGTASIGDYAFASSAITTIVIPEDCTELGHGIFWGCTNLAEVTLDADLTKLPSKAFYNCTALESIELPDTLAEIGDHAFFNCVALSAIELPAGLTTLGSYSMSYSGITSIALPVGVTQIADKTFDHCAALTSVTVNGNITAIGNYAFAESAITSFEIPETCTSVGNGVFYKCTALENVGINAELNGIYSKMFYGCTALTSVNIPDTVVNIHPYAFYNCTSLATVEIPAGLKLIQDYAFANTSSLAINVTIPGSVKVIGEKCFMGSGVSGVILGEGVETVSDSAFENAALTNAYIPATVQTIGNKAFAASSVVSIHTEASAGSVIAWAADNTEYVTCVTDYVPADETIVVVYSEEELNAALLQGKIIKIASDITLDAGIVIPADAAVTIDLYGNAISLTKECSASYEMILNNGSLTIMDSVGTGKITFTDTGAGDAAATWGSYTILNNGTLTVNGGTIENLSAQNVQGKAFAHTSLAIFQYAGTTTVNGGKISTPNYRSVRLWKGDLIIKGGEFDGQVWVQCVDDSARLVLRGGEFSPNWNDGSSVFINNVKDDGTLCYVRLYVYGGTFATKLGANATIKNAVIADGYTATENANGSLTVVNNAE